MLDILADGKRSLGLFELARLIAEREDGEVSDPDEAVERRVIGLHHNHLPKLEDAGLIRYDCESKRIEALHAGTELEVQQYYQQLLEG